MTPARFLILPFVLSLALGSAFAGDSPVPFRPPATPLVAHDPNFSIWSEADHLTDDATRHWTHAEHSLESLIRVDGRSYRLMGVEPRDTPALPQTGLQVTPTRSIYEFENSLVHVTLTFASPMLPDDLDLLTRPVTYLTWEVRSLDGSPHTVSIFAGASSELAVNEPNQKVECARETIGGLTALRAGTVDQTLLVPAGDGVRIDWGYVYAAAPAAESTAAIGKTAELLQKFVSGDGLTAKADLSGPHAVGDGKPALGFGFEMGKVGSSPVSRHLMLAYDEIYSIRFFSTKLRPYWRRNGATPATLLAAAERDYPKLMQRCTAFDRQLTEDMTAAGGARYAQIGALAYRQGFAGCGFAADSKGQLLIFTKENTSNGCVATVDVFYPAAPQFLLFGSAVAKALVAPALVYSTAEQWKFPFAPHDLGVYPQATGMVYGGGESPGHESEKMPVEESGNMILLCDAISRMDGNADFASQWWTQLGQWESYLEKFGNDPEDQLCTDDFMGHLAHNANLSVKAILAIAAYGDLCRLRGDAAGAKKYFDLAKADAAHWMAVARDGDHYRLAFDKPNSWSQKYNLVWDRILGLGVFPASVARDEVAHYKKVMERYGVPLDSRTRLTKTDWSLWVATLAENRTDFEAIVSPIYDYLNETTARLPLVDSYVTDNRGSDGMHARPVVGGVFVKMLADPAIWKKYSAQGAKTGDQWAPFPPVPHFVDVVPTSKKEPAVWRYTIAAPPAAWSQPAFEDASWKEGPGGFGTAMTPGSVVRTTWKTDDIWLRRTVTIPEGAPANLQFLVHHDEDVEIYVDGVLAASAPGFISQYEPMEIRAAARALLRPGARVVLAVHCHQTTGGQYVDVGIVGEK